MQRGSRTSAQLAAESCFSILPLFWLIWVIASAYASVLNMQAIYRDNYQEYTVWYLLHLSLNLCFCLCLMFGFVLPLMKLNARSISPKAAQMKSIWVGFSLLYVGLEILNQLVLPAMFASSEKLYVWQQENPWGPTIIVWFIWLSFPTIPIVLSGFLLKQRSIIGVGILLFILLTYVIFLSLRYEFPVVRMMIHILAEFLSCIPLRLIERRLFILNSCMT